MLRRLLFTCLLLSTLQPTVLAQTPFRLSRNTVVTPAYVGSYDLTVGDVDGDGDLDVVTGNDHDPNELLLNDGRGAFFDATAGRLITPSTPPPGGYFANATYEVDLVDIDGDGDLDLLVANDHVLPNRVYTNNGAGFFTDVTATALPNIAHDSFDQVILDFDGDGDLDWLVLGYPGPILLANNGLGVFTDVSATNLSAYSPYYPPLSSSAVDLDVDGDLDVLAPDNGGLRILVNQGGVLTMAPAGLFVGATNDTAFAADVDADGLPDLFLNGGRRLLRNLGGLVFVDETVTRLPAGWSKSVEVALDFDLDGDIDAIGYDGVLLVNSGLGYFTEVPALPTSASYAQLYTPKVADIDDDGDPDLFDRYSVYRGSPWINFHNQLHTPTPPTLGAPYTIEFHNPVRTTPVIWAPAVANLDTLMPLPPFLGMLRLDPTSATTLWPVFVTTGQGTIVWTLPVQPVLLGTALHYQAAVFDPLRLPFLSNAVRDVIQ